MHNKKINTISGIAIILAVFTGELFLINSTYKNTLDDLSFYSNSQLASVSSSIDQDLVTHYSFDEGSGNTAGDSSGNGNNGTLENGPTWTSGRVGSGALQFDGVDDSVSAGRMSSTFEGSTAFTISTWVNLSSIGPSITFISKAHPLNDNNYINFGTTDGNFEPTGRNVSLSFYSNKICSTLSNFLQAGTWYHMVAVYDGTQSTNATRVKIYVNGSPVSLTCSGTFPAVSPSETRTVRIGSTDNSQRFFPGLMDDVRIYDRALSASDVSDLYTQTSGGGGGGGGGPDNTPPVISNISSGTPSQSGATIRWRTDESSDTQMEYGLTNSYGNSTTLNTSLVTSHSATLSSLPTNTTYHYRVKSKDATGNLATSADQSFTTAVAGASGYVCTGTTCTANTCSEANVQAAIDASSNGDTVRIPAGSCSWTTTMTLSKAIKLQGAGAGRIIGWSRIPQTFGTGLKTFIVQNGFTVPVGTVLRVWETATDKESNYMLGTVTNVTGTALTMNITTNTGPASNTPGNQFLWLLATEYATRIVHDAGAHVLLTLSENTNGNVDVSGIQFTTGSGTGNDNEGGLINLSYTNGGKPILLHDNWFYQTKAYDIILDRSTNRGVIYNNSFNWSYFALSNSPALHLPVYSRSEVWSMPSTMGMADTDGTHNLYVEDNDFHAGMTTVDLDSNSKVVWRYNIMDHAQIGSHGYDTGTFGARHWEIYNNQFLFANNGYNALGLVWWMLLRGGTGVIADNYIENIISNAWSDKSEINFGVWNLGRWSAPPGAYSANDGGVIQYPSPRQFGFGYVTGVGVDGQGHSHSEPTGFSPIYVGDSEPTYIWNNTGMANPAIMITADGTAGVVNQYGNIPDDPNGYIQQGRDYFLGVAKPGYQKYYYPHPLRTGFQPPPPPTVSDSDNDGVPNSSDLCPNTPADSRGAVNSVGCPRPKMTSFDIKPSVEGNLNSVSGVEIGKSNIAKIHFSNAVSLIRSDGGQLDIEGNLSISHGRISLNSTNLSSLNHPATLTFYNVNINPNSPILRDGGICADCHVVSYTNQTLVFTVPGFSTYEIVEDTGFFGPLTRAALSR